MPERGMKIGILGGTFDPLHRGHLIIAEKVGDALGLDRVVFIPSARPPHKRSEAILDISHRLNMVKLATRGNRGFEVSSIEAERGGVSYTVDTVRSLKEESGADAEHYFIIGSDTIYELHTWKDIDVLVGLCQFVVVGRPGYSLDEIRADDVGLDEETARSALGCPVAIEPIGISSTAIRAMVRRGEAVGSYVPEPVEKYIAEHGLYRD